MKSFILWAATVILVSAGLSIPPARALTLDVAPTDINNIPSDTSYATGSSNVDVEPVVTVSNVGNETALSFNVTMTVSPGGYSSTRNIPFLNAGATFPVTFDLLSIPLNQAISITVYTSLVDGNASNDTLRQTTVVLPGTPRRVLLEEWTSSTCPPCASQNPTIDFFIEQYPDNIVTTKYHVWWPSPGNDPMYLANVSQITDRVNYYGVNLAPTIKLDGVLEPERDYSTWDNLQNAYDARINRGSPMSLTVTSTRTAADTIHAEVSISIVSPLTHGSYYLRVHGIEEEVWYTGTNGEPDHYAVFRRAYMNSSGLQIPTALGNYNYTFDYAINPAWDDTMIYTIAFVQNDATKEVANAAKSGRTQTPTGIASTGDVPVRLALHQNYPNPFNPTTEIRYELPAASRVVLRIYNVLGQEVRTLVDRTETAGLKTVHWDGMDQNGRAAASGVYLYRLEAGTRTLSRKMLLLQ